MKMTKELQENDISPNEFAETLTNITEINELINNLTDVTNQQDYDNILLSIPKDKPIFRKACFNKIKKKTEFSIKEIRTRYNELHNPPKVKNDATGRILSINEELDKLRKQYRNY